MLKRKFVLSCLAVSTLVGCSNASSELDELGNETGVFEEAQPVAIGEDFESREDSITGPTYRPGSSTEVWALRNAWADTDTAEARQAGLAWGANSGLNWEEKYQAWVGSLEKITGWQGYDTFKVKTPWGTEFESPRLECADTAMWMRVTFASWYGLPFFMRARMNGTNVYAGHFGFIKADGTAFAGFPAFRTAYGVRTDWNAGGQWSSDANLRKLHIGSDDENEFLEADRNGNRGAGAYYDQTFMNKRVGYFLRILDGYFGSMNLADDANMYQVKTLDLRPGDAVVHRYDSGGIGHTLPIMRVESEGGYFAAELASGSMPRRQPHWENAESSYYSFDYAGAGGPEYSRFGGGFKRFRTPVCSTRSGGTVTCTASPFVPSSQILQSDRAAIEARVTTIGEVWRQYTDEQRLQNQLDRIEAARNRIRERPATCSGRRVREEAFEGLYELTAGLGYSRTQVDAQYRTLEDYVFSELVYEQSKTCCWNSTTSAMYEIVMAYNEDIQTRATFSNMCAEPVVFRAVNETYDIFKNYAVSIGRGSEWVAWRADEACPQASDSMRDDVIATSRDITAFCSL